MNIKGIDLILSELPHAVPLRHLFGQVVLQQLQHVLLVFQLDSMSPIQDILDLSLGDHGEVLESNALVAVEIEIAVEIHELLVLIRVILFRIN